MNNTTSLHAEGRSPHRPTDAAHSRPARRDYACLAGWATVIVGLAVICTAFVIV